MQTVLLIIHLLVVISLVTVIMLQQSTAGGLGFGGDKDFMSARGAKTALTRFTAILAAIFFVISLLLTIVANFSNSAKDVLKHLPTSKQTQQPINPKPINITVGGNKGSTGGQKQQSNSKNIAMPIVIPDSVLESIKKNKHK